MSATRPPSTGGARTSSSRRANDIPRWRLSLLAMVAVALFAALFARLYSLQIVEASDYQVQAEANRERLVQVAAPRGRILDRNGKVVVDNRISIFVGVERNAFNRLSEHDQNELLLKLAGELSRDGHPANPEEMRRRIQDQRFSRYAPVPVAQDVSESLKIYLEEHADQFPAVSVQRTTVRHYPYGPLAANVVGYVGKINESELAEVREVADKPYTQNDDIGKTGVEASYEAHLRGTPGLRRIEVDANGDPVRVISETAPVPGSDVTLTIDIDIQALAQQHLEQALARVRGVRQRDGSETQGTRGSVVVEDPNNGQVIAMASYPTYDPEPFVDGIDQQEWAYLNDPANNYPLNNYAIQGQWATGSTFKLFTGYAALHSGLMAGDTVFYDSGGYQIPNCTGARCYRSNAGGAAYGRISMPEAITVSSDAYFYNVGAQFWNQRDRLGGDEGMQNYIRHFGFGQATGIPLDEEVDGRLPTAQWRREYCEATNCNDPVWRAGDNVNLAVGQGDLVVTPLQLANGYATFANGGTRYTPQIAASIDPPGADTAPVAVGSHVAEQVDIPPHVRQPLYDGLVGVTQHGTAAGAFGGFNHQYYPVAGKTGTAQVDNHADTALFAAFGPAPAPQYSIAVVMEQSGFGGRAAAPVARALFDVLSGAVPKPAAPLGGRPAAPVADQTQVGGAYD